TCQRTSTLLSSHMDTPTTLGAWLKAISQFFRMRVMYLGLPSSISGSAASTCERRASLIVNCVKICVPLADRSTFIKPGDEVVSGITAVDAAGHSLGLLALLI